MKLRYILPYIPKLVSLSKDAQRKLEWFDWYIGHKKNARLTCRYFGISPDTFYRWKRRFNSKDLNTLEDDKSNRRPHRLREMTTPREVIREVYLVRKEDPEKSKYEIQEELKRNGIYIGTSTIQKIINMYPDLKNIQHLKRVRASRNHAIARNKAPRDLKNKLPGSLVQIDTKHYYLLGKKYYIFAAIDCKTRLGYINAYRTGSSLSAEEFLIEAINAMPIKIEAVQTDNGSEYLLNFHKGCINQGIKHYFIDPQCPRQNGRVERFIETLVYEFFNYQYDLLDDLPMIRQRCVEFNIKYNTKRYHRMLGYKTPTEYLEEINSRNLVKSNVYGM